VTLRLPDPDEHPTLPAVPWLGFAFDKRRTTVQRLCRLAVNGHPEALPVRVMLVGNSYRVATAELRRALGLDPGHDGGAPEGASVEKLTPAAATAGEDRHGGS
jgi:hypothetical protein